MVAEREEVIWDREIALTAGTKKGLTSALREMLLRPNWFAARYVRTEGEQSNCGWEERRWLWRISVVCYIVCMLFGIRRHQPVFQV